MMGFFSRHKNVPKRTVEEQNKHNEEIWKIEDWAKNDAKEKEDRESIEQEVKLLKESGVDKEFIKQFLLNKTADEGINISEDGTEYWVCVHCENSVKFDTKEEYVSHHYRHHS